MQLVVYTDAGVRNCCQEPGSLGYEAIDMATFASWGADSVSVDYCGGPEDVQGAYQKFADGVGRRFSPSSAPSTLPPSPPADYKVARVGKFGRGPQKLEIRPSPSPFL